MSDVSLIHRYQNRKHDGYGNERKFLWCISFVQGITQNVSFSFVSLRDRQGDEETCVGGSANVW